MFNLEKEYNKLRVQTNNNHIVDCVLVCNRSVSKITPKQVILIPNDVAPHIFQYIYEPPVKLPEEGNPFSNHINQLVQFLHQTYPLRQIQQRYFTFSKWYFYIISVSYRLAIDQINNTYNSNYIIPIPIKYIEVIDQNNIRVKIATFGNRNFEIYPQGYQVPYLLVENNEVIIYDNNGNATFA